MRWFSPVIALIVVALAVGMARGQNLTVSGQVIVQHVEKKRQHDAANQNVVIWLTPLDPKPVALSDPPRYRMLQKDKQFHPHVLALPVGAAVDFPNEDPFFHNVFSLYKGKKFDLGLYEAGTSRTVRFERPGVSFVFCNIHPQMNAYVLALDTPYFAISDSLGRLSIPSVPPGRYHVEVWYERSESTELAKLRHDVVVSASNASLGTIAVTESAHFVPPHMNKHGHPYETDRVPY